MKEKILSFKIYAVLSNFYEKKEKKKLRIWRMEAYVSAVPAYEEMVRLNLQRR